MFGKVTLDSRKLTNGALEVANRMYVGDHRICALIAIASKNSIIEDVDKMNLILNQTSPDDYFLKILESFFDSKINSTTLIKGLMSRSGGHRSVESQADLNRCFTIPS